MTTAPHSRTERPTQLADDERSGRAFCYRCHKAQSTCVCTSIAVVDNSIDVLIVQHPAEQHHPVGSVRFARLGLSRCEVVVAAKGADGALRTERPFPDGAALLYPSDQARALECLPLHERPRSLVLVDGTWSTVRPLLAGDPRLRALPRVCIAPKVAGRYRIRREPRIECVSTLEALVEALRILQPGRDSEWDGLLDAFDTMIDRQIAIASSRGTPRHRRPSTRPQFRAVPVELGLAHGPMVVVHVESTQVNRLAEPGTRRRRQIVSLQATRLAADAASSRFDQLVAIEGEAPSDAQLHHMGLPSGALETGCTPAELAARWAEFARPGDRLCAWNQMTLDLVAALASSPPAAPSRAYVLKGIYAALQRQRGGELELACARAGLELDPPGGQTRGRTRADAAVAIYQWLADGRARPAG